jgi:hypothetical protein
MKKDIWETHGEMSEFSRRGVRIRVHHHRDHPQEQWLTTCYFDNIECEPLPEEKLKDAKQHALAAAKAHLKLMLKEVDEAMKT